MTLRATLFDMDGLLIDSEILWHKAELEIFGDLGVPIAEQDGRQTKGLFVNEVVSHWFKLYPWRGPSEAAVVEQLLQRVGDLVEAEGVLLPGVEHVLALTSERGPIAVASSTPLELIYRCLDAFNLRTRFQTISSAQFEPYGKPHPGVFITSAKSVGVEPVECLIFEDSPAGVLAAKASRATVVAVPVSEDRHLPHYGLADLVLGSLDELTSSWLDERFA